jgi:hypothetical protein
VEAKISAADDRKRWLTRVASRVSEGEIDPADPAWMPLLQEIWGSGPQKGRETLADAVLVALGRGAPHIAETALRLWLHVHLSPEDLRLCPSTIDCARSAIRAALVLPTGTT